MKRVFLQQCLLRPWLIVEAKTGIEYSHQCGGSQTTIINVEGYLIPCEPFYDDPVKWNEKDYIEKCGRELVEALPVMTFLNANNKDTWELVRYDLNRIEEAIEAWVPITTSLGKGVLIWDNSD